jgi:hypothetical protein
MHTAGLVAHRPGGVYAAALKVEFRSLGVGLAYRGSQPSSFLAFSFEDPRQLVIWVTTELSASSRPSQAGICSGGFASKMLARYGSHSATGAGSLSTTL